VPPTPLQLQILLALATGETYGAELSRRVTRDSQSVLLIRDNTFYPVLSHLAAIGWVERVPPRTYRLIRKGWRVLEQEQRRVGHLATLLHQRTRID
jgi:DNA-binding PadR family transcriptional regulator